MKNACRQAITLLTLLIVPCLVVAEDRIITGTTRLDKDTYIKADTITFQDGSLIITNGFCLTVEGRLKIRLEGTPRIGSFEPRNPSAGDPGRSAGPVIIQTALLDGTRLRIENVGEYGTKGADGAPGPQGGKGAQGTQRDWNPWNGCIGGSNGKPGGQGGDGGNGGAGGNGGSGGAIVFNIKTGFWNGSIARLDMVVIGGMAGQPGIHGAPGSGGPGGDGAPGTFHCGGTDPGPSGPAGRPGLDGVAGTPGNPGQIIDVNGNSLPASLTTVEKSLYQPQLR